MSKGGYAWFCCCVVELSLCRVLEKRRGEEEEDLAMQTHNACSYTADSYTTDSQCHASHAMLLGADMAMTACVYGSVGPESQLKSADLIMAPLAYATSGRQVTKYGLH